MAFSKHLEKMTLSTRVQEKNIFKLPCALQLWDLAQSHLPQWDYIKFEMSTSIQAVWVGQKWIWWGGWGWKSNKQKVRSDHSKNELNEAGNIKQRSKNQLSSVYFVSPCLSALFTSSSCSANRSHDWRSIFQPPGLLWSWCPSFGAGSGIPHLEMLRAAFSNQSLVLQWHLSSSS